MLQHAMTQRVFYEPKPGYVAHTQASRILAEDDNMRDFSSMYTLEIWPSASKVTEALEKWPTGREARESGFL
jgi:hypothetical protein